MIQVEELYSIPHPEYRAVNHLIDAHRKVYGDLLRAVVAFGADCTGCTEGTPVDLPGDPCLECSFMKNR